MTTVSGWPDYQKSSRSEGGNSCVAVDRFRMSVRDTKNMAAGVLQVTNLAAAFAAIKAGRFDLA